MLMHKSDYKPMSEEIYEEKIKKKTIANINRKMKRFGIKQEDLNLTSL